jgi:mRNA interferase MazF
MAVATDEVRRGSVVLVRLPGDKARPAVVVRSDLLADLSYATVLPLTTDIRADLSIRVAIPPSAANGLRETSQVMADWPQTVRLSEFGGVIGHLDTETMRRITQQLLIVLGVGSAAPAADGRRKRR